MPKMVAEIQFPIQHLNAICSLLYQHLSIEATNASFVCQPSRSGSFDNRLTGIDGIFSCV
jgi:hypothetical protein